MIASVSALRDFDAVVREYWRDISWLQSVIGTSHIRGDDLVGQ